MKEIYRGIWFRIDNPYRTFCLEWWLFWLELPAGIVLTIRDFIHRGLYGYAKSDMYDFYTYHAQFMVNTLTDFKKGLTGYPFFMESMDEWEDLIDRLIVAFYARSFDEHEIASSYDDEYEKYLERDFAGAMTEEQKVIFRRVCKDADKREEDSRLAFRSAMEEFANHYNSFWH